MNKIAKKKTTKKTPAFQCRRHIRDKRSIPELKPLEEGIATCCSILAWEIPWTKNPGGLQSTRSKRVR